MSGTNYFGLVLLALMLVGGVLGFKALIAFGDRRRAWKAVGLPRLVRVGPKLAIRQLDDRWGWLINAFEATDWGWLDEPSWEKLKDYQTPINLPPPRLPGGLRPEELFKLAMESPYGKEMERKVNLPGRPMTLWEFQARHRDGGWIRFVAPMSYADQEPYIVRWNWFQAYLLRPIYATVARVLPWFHRGDFPGSDAAWLEENDEAKPGSEDEVVS